MLLLALALAGVAAAIPTTLDLGYSTIRGQSLDAGVNQYLGVRFAAPPLGSLRFRAPADPAKTKGIQDASEFGPICIGTGQSATDPTMSEDCLYINVFAPSNATPNSKLPVWFWIQGGGYVYNSNSNYNGTELVQRSGGNLVVVNFNYRVGAYGFLASEQVRKDGDLNAGLLDQRKALEWVQKYIRLFGGDPKQVVIHGASAGAGSVALHMLAYGGQNSGLFHGAIGTSPFFPVQPKVCELEWQFSRFVSAAGCSKAKNALTCLRSKDTATLQVANAASPYPGRPGAPLWYFTPTVDGELLQDYPYRQLAEGRIVRVPTIWGDDTDEGSIFAANASSVAEVTAFLKNNYPRLSNADALILNKLYPKMEPLPQHNEYFPSASMAYGEATFTCGGLLLSDVMAFITRQKTWNYRYNVLDDANFASGLGVPHTYMVPAVFGVGYAGTTGVGSGYETYNREIIPVVQGYFSSFVRTLDPNVLRHPSSPRWEEFVKRQRRVVLQTNATTMEAVPRNQKERCSFWQSLGIKLEQ